MIFINGRNIRNKRKFKHTHVREAIYIKRILKQVSKGTKIQVNSVQVLTSLTRDISKRLIVESAHLLSLRKKSTLTAREIQTSVRLHLSGEIAKHAVSEGLRAASSSEKKTTIPASYVKANIKAMNYNFRISKNAPIYLAAVIEYLLAEILELANNIAKDNKKVLITPQFISQAIHNDEELDKLFGSAIIPGGGVTSLIMQFSTFGVFSKNNDEDKVHGGVPQQSSFGSSILKKMGWIGGGGDIPQSTGFGGGAVTQPSSFNFGAPQSTGFGSAVAQPSSFNFGAPQSTGFGSAVTQPSSFNFGAPQLTGFGGAVPQPGSFNFGGGGGQSTGFGRSTNKKR